MRFFFFFKYNAVLLIFIPLNAEKNQCLTDEKGQSWKSYLEESISGKEEWGFYFQ